MNEKRVFSLLGFLLFLLIAGCSGGQDNAPPLQRAKLGGAFTLVDQDGKQVSDRQFDGKYRIVYFGYTFCPDVCPIDLQTIGRAMRQLDKSDPALSAKVQPIFITVDPERDTPQVLKQYVSAFYPRLIGLTGSTSQIEDVKKKFGIFSQKADRADASEYAVDHSRIVFLFGPKGEPIAILPHEQGAEAVAAEIKRWVR